jgi:hypothetical protein
MQSACRTIVTGGARTAAVGARVRASVGLAAARISRDNCRRMLTSGRRPVQQAKGARAGKPAPTPVGRNAILSSLFAASDRVGEDWSDCVAVYVQEGSR